MPSRVALWCWYHGEGFRGYQAQRVGPTVQHTVMAALRAAGYSRNPVVCSRTDLGVHARMQVLSMRVVEGESVEELPARLNAALPANVGIIAARPVGSSFHAAWSSAGKTYRYRLLLDDEPTWSPVAWRVNVDLDRLERAVRCAVGTRDFAQFHDSSSAVRPRTITEVSLHRGAHVAELRIRGDAFGRYMVRQLVGGAVDVATGATSLEAFQAALDGLGRLRPTRAPANGLVLWEVEYPAPDDPFAALRHAPDGLPDRPPFCAGA